MVRRFTIAAVSISLSIWLAASLDVADAAKDQSRIGEEPKPQPSPNSPFSPGNDELDLNTPGDNSIPDAPFEILEPDEIPHVKSIELTLDMAKRAIRALDEVHNKYEDQGIADYDTLEEFVAATDAGKRLESDVRRYGFTNITDWNDSISSVGYAYLAVVHDEDEQIRQQISEIQIDPEISAAEKERLVGSLEAMISSANNRSIIRQLMRDDYYAAKLQLLEQTE